MKLIPPVIYVLLLSGSVLAQTLEVVPARVMTDEAVAIRAAGLAPNERVDIRSELTDGAGATWTAQAEFLADAQGEVDASKQWQCRSWLI